MLNKISFIDKIRYFNLMVGAALAIAHQLGDVALWVDYSFFALFLVVLGIPHGAIDHFVVARIEQKNGRTFSFLRFLAVYLLQMALYAILWIFFPALSLLLFLVLSAWHFGQSDIQPAPTHILWGLGQLISGALILFYILLREPLLTANIIKRITRGNQAFSDFWRSAVNYQAVIMFGILFFVVLIFIWAQKTEPIRIPSTHFLRGFLLLLIIYFLPLLPAFALYFGGWHAVNTFQHISQFLKQDNTLIDLWKKTMLFTLFAFLFMILVGFVWWKSYAYLDPLPVIFVFISIITLPHLLVMHKMFQIKSNHNSIVRNQFLHHE